LCPIRNLLPDNENMHTVDIFQFLRHLELQLRRPPAIVGERMNPHDWSEVVRAHP